MDYVRSYIEAQDLTLLGGVRFEIPARGTVGVFEYDVDFTFDGYVLGFEFIS